MENFLRNIENTLEASQKTETSVTIIVEGTFREGYQEYFDHYSKLVRNYLEKHGGKVIRRQRIEKTLYGDYQPSLIMLIDFPSREVAEKIFFEKEYVEIIPTRDKVFSSFKMYLAPIGNL